jgi:hypothetical protein
MSTLFNHLLKQHHVYTITAHYPIYLGSVWCVYSAIAAHHVSTTRVHAEPSTLPSGLLAIGSPLRPVLHAQVDTALGGIGRGCHGDGVAVLRPAPRGASHP